MGIILTIIGLLAVGLLSAGLINYGDNHGWFLGENHYHNMKK